MGIGGLTEITKYYSILIYFHFVIQILGLFQESNYDR